MITLPTAAIIIPVHNGEAYLAACIEALLQQHPPATIIAVENGSSDQSATLIASRFPQVRLLRSPQPLGFAAAINLGVQAALTLPKVPEALVLLNQDTIVDPGWLAALLGILAADPHVGIVGSIARFADGTVQHAAAALLAPRWYGKNLLSSTLPEGATAFVSFLGVALRTQLIQQIGLLDEAYGSGYYEDADYCLRAVAAGWQLAIAQQATLLHHEGASQRSDYPHTARVERNRIRTILKHYPLSDPGVTEPDPQAIAPLWEAERATVIAAANAGTSQALRQAYLHGLLMLPAIARERNLTAVQQEALTTTLATLRDHATQRERRSRTWGLSQSPAPQEKSYGRTDVPAPHAASAPAALPAPAVSAPAVSTPRVSIIMLTWNGLAVTQACIESIRTYTDPATYQLLVVDNGSTDGTREWLEAQTNITLIANRTNLGFTHGNNQGMAAAPAGNNLLLLNNDTLITHAGWLDHLQAVAHSHTSYGIVGCTLLHSNGRLQHAGTYMPDSLWGYQIGGGERYLGQYPGVRVVDGITGACMYIRRDVYNTIGGLNPAYFSYYEDSDYCMRARRAGFQIVVTGAVQIIHHENTSSRVNQSDWQAMFSMGRQIFERTWRETLDQRYTRHVVWHSLFAASTGYATSSRELVRELDAALVDVRTACIFGTDYTEPKTNDPRVDQLLSRPKDLRLPQVVYSQADAFIKNSGRIKIGFTMHETDGLPADWVQQCNAMDEVWTPTAWGKEVFQASGVTQPIHVIPLGFNPDYFHPQIMRRRPQARYVFLSVFDWIERKAPDLLIKAYTRTFAPHEDVLLILKVGNSDPYFDLPRHLASLIGSGPTPPISVLLNQKIPAAEMGALYRSADCFVLPTRGEGWGMPTLEAMACGLPVISTGWGAQSEFLHAGVGYPLAIRGLAPAITRSPYYAGTQWAEPDLDHLCTLMRYVYENPEAAAAVGAAAAIEVHQRWTWQHAAEKIIARLDCLR
jgi:GT2 family glycosyltransferase/glycosyltransferase involved in cell wall biosynthesis